MASLVFQRRHGRRDEDALQAGVAAQFWIPHQTLPTKESFRFDIENKPES